MNRTSIFFLIILFMGFSCSKVSHKKSKYFTDSKHVAILGYDPIGYFMEKKAVKGNSQFQLKWDGVFWQFSSQKNLETFHKNPKEYIPQYGGYCAWAMARGDFAKIDPLVWKIVDNKLYLNFDKKIGQLWEKDIPEFIQKADKHWQRIHQDFKKK